MRQIKVFYGYNIEERSSHLINWFEPQSTTYVSVNVIYS